MRSAILFCVITILLTVAKNVRSATDWLSAPKPKFPASALQKGSEGSVKVRVTLSKDGSVAKTTVLKSSGDRILDQTAQNAVLKWRMKPSAIKPADMTKGRDEIIDFRQEAPIAAAHPDRVGAFTHKGVIAESELSKIWMFAPFPSYPLDARRLRQQGRVLVGLIIDKNGKPQNVSVIRSSGYAMLDQAAVHAVALWRAHREYGGRHLAVPITFKLTFGVNSLSLPLRQ